MKFKNKIYRWFYPVKTNFKAVKKLHSLKGFAQRTLKFQNIKLPYVLERVESVDEYAMDWDRIEERYEYLADILTQEYLDINITLTEKERQVARECHRRIGAFLKQCQQYRDTKKQKLTIEQKYEPRIINN